jgi:hypothetical protein
VLTAGSGSDRIILRQGNGFDRFTDFQNNQDTIDLLGIDFGQLNIQQSGDDVLIKLDGTKILLLENTNVNVINRRDFV